MSHSNHNHEKKSSSRRSFSYLAESGKSERKCESKCHKKCEKSIVELDRTVFVDPQFGSNSRGQLNTPNCPFRSINAAIAAIPKKLTLATQWSVQIRPGNFAEDVNVPLFVNLTGSGQNLTIIRSIKLVGTSSISNLTVAGNTLPLISTQIDNSEPAQNQASFLNVNILAKGIVNTRGLPVISIKGSGLNNSVTFTNVNIDADVLPSNPSGSSQILFETNALLTLKNTQIFYLTQYSASTSMFNINDGAKVTIEGGNFELRVSEGPAEEVNVFNVNGGALLVNGNGSTVIILQIAKPYLADVSYIKSNSASSIFVSNSSALLDGIPNEFLNLVHNLNQFSQIQLLSLTTPATDPAPRIKGFKESVKYSVQPADGSFVGNGGLYTNIVTVDESADGYFVQENDYTVLSNGSNVHIFDPTLANEQVIDKGKIVVIKNIGPSSIIVDSQDDTIFDGTLTLNASQSVTLQNNGKLWYVIARS
jgi:hypothetical protein